MCHQARAYVSTGMGAPILGRIDLRAAIELCREYGGTRHDLEKVLLVEDVVWPRLNKRE